MQNMFVLDNIYIFFDHTLLEDGRLFYGLDRHDWSVLGVFTLVLLSANILQSKYSLRQKIAQMPLVARWLVYWLGFMIVVLFGMYGRGYVASSFIYGGF